MINVLSIISSFLINGFTITTLLLLLFYMLLPNARQLLFKVGVCSNIFLLAGSTCFLLLIIKQLLTTLFSQDEAEQYMSLSRFFGPYWFSYWGAVLAQGIFPHLLWWQKLRRLFQSSIALAVLQLLYLLLPTLLTSYRDYLPSSWIISSDYWWLILAAVPYSMLVSLTYLLAYKLRGRPTN